MMQSLSFPSNSNEVPCQHIFESVKHSLERLQLDYIDLLQCKRSSRKANINLVDSSFSGHRFDYDTPIKETMQALHDVVKAGYVRYVGMSSCYAWQCEYPRTSARNSKLATYCVQSRSLSLVQKMQNYAHAHGLTEFISMQNLHNAIYREEEREMVPLLQDLGVGMIPWSPLATGFLTRSVKEQTIRGKTDL